MTRLVSAIGLSDMFRASIETAIADHPGINEARAEREAAIFQRSEARAQRFPSGEVALSSFRTLARDFSNDPQNIIERSRARQRTDLTLNIQQPLIDFGATSKRIAAAGLRVEGADATVEARANQVALSAIAAWYDVFAYRALVAIGSVHAKRQQQLRAAVEERIGRGLSAPGDVAEVDSYIAAAAGRLATYERQLANAEARYTELIGAPPPATLTGEHRSRLDPLVREAVIAAAGETAEVRAAYAEARAADRDADAARSDNLPQLVGGIDAGRYGVFETDRDYDIRARLTLRYRLFGGRTSRARQAEARAVSAGARAQRLRAEAERDAVIALSDLAAFEAARDAQEASYHASRISRDVLAERFRVARGTLGSVLQSEDNLFGAAAQYILAEVELEVGRYALMARTGRLLSGLGVDSAGISEKRKIE
ncbi:TolC family protein [Sphingopyxis sp. LARHCG72]